jgi:hypothetical protein
VQQIHQNTILKVGEYQFKVIIIDKNYDEFAYWHNKNIIFLY